MSLSPRRPASAMDPKGEFPLDVKTYVFHLFAVVSRHREARLEQDLRPLGLTLARHRALGVIASLQSCTMSELAEFSAVDRTTLTRTVDQLVDGALVERSTPREDRRQVLLTLTDEGKRAVSKSLRVIAAANTDLVDGLPEERQREVARAFEAFLGALVDDPALLKRLTLRDEEI